MSERRPSITRWRDPDTGKLVGPGDDDVNGRWLSRITRLGPAFDNAPKPAESVPAATAVMAPPPATTGQTSEEVEALKLDILRMKNDGDSEGLRAVAQAEYGRSDGGRISVKRALASAGVSRPEV